MQVAIHVGVLHPVDFDRTWDATHPVPFGTGADIDDDSAWRLLQKLENKDVNLRAATTFSLNDFISNGGIVVAGVLVMWLGVNWPDLVVGLATAAIQLWGGIKILRDA